MLSTLRPSLFARSTIPKIVYEEKLLTECINFLPVELKREILSYLHMGIILSLYEQPKTTIMYCMRMERQDRNLTNTSISFFAEYSARELIHLILFTESINKKFIMRHLIDYKKRETQTQKRKHDEKVEQSRLSLLLDTGDYFLNKLTYHNYLIVRKTKCGFKAIKIIIRQHKIIIPPNPKIFAIKFTSICTKITIPERLMGWLQRIDILNTSPIININDKEPVKREDVVQFVLANLHT
jgi:hypothetical protein